MKRSSSMVSLLLLAAGCAAPGQFSRTDPTFHPAKVRTKPPVFADQRPSRAYRTVGVIAIEATEDSPAAEVALAVATKAQEIGCDAVVARHLASAPTTWQPDWAPQILLVHDGDHKPQAAERPTQGSSGGDRPSQGGGAGDRPSLPGSPVERSRPMRTFEFDCAMFTDSVPATRI